MNNLEFVQEEIERIELEIENIRCGISDWATIYNVDSKEDAEQILNEELECLQLLASHCEGTEYAENFEPSR